MTKKQLWLNLHHYHFDDLVPPNLWDQLTARFGKIDASTKAFANKLALKKGWNNAFALKATQEYKRFVDLGVVSDFVVTPSEVIDKVWHQHILFSRAYRHFCTNVIYYEFDHNPELINLTDQTGTFNAQYIDTMKLYKTEFGFYPPDAIWGKPKFDEKVVTGVRSRSKTKTLQDVDRAYTFSEAPLHESFAGDNDFAGFDAGDGGGGGADSTWGDSTGSAGSDSGSSDCSSGCGGGD